MQQNLSKQLKKYFERNSFYLLVVVIINETSNVILKLCQNQLFTK